MNDPMNSDGSGGVRLGRKGDRPYWVLIISVMVRAAHQIGAAVFLSSYLFKGSLTLPGFYLALVFVTGGILLITESIRHRQFFRELIGVSTVVKLIFIGMAFHGGIAVKLLIVISFVLASICSHLPKNVRHRLMF